MNTDTTITWQTLSREWKFATRALPELNGPLHCLRVPITKPKYGPVFHFDWVPKQAEESAVQAGIATLASGWPEVGSSWTKGTLKTAELLVHCETEDELAAVWICAFTRSLLFRGIEGNAKWNAMQIERESRSIFSQKYGFWHTSSRELFPEFYIPAELFWDNSNLSVSVLIELAALNAALVMAHFTPVEYKKV